MAYQLDALIFQGFITTIQGLDNSMACEQSDSAIIQTDILDTIETEVFALT